MNMSHSCEHFTSLGWASLIVVTFDELLTMRDAAE
jgi:hypothetical protein